MKVNDLIRCDDVRGSESLEGGAIYRIVEIDQYGNLGIAKQHPNNSKAFLAPLQHFYKPSRFKLVKSKNLKQEENKIDLSKTYQTRNGRQVALFVVSADPDYPVVGQIFENGQWRNEQWTLKGRFLSSGCGNNDLIDVKDEEEFTINNLTVTFYKEDGSIWLTSGGENVPLSQEQFREIISRYETFIA
jgi:hypothetical protein